MGSPPSLTSSLFTFHALRSVAGRSSNALAPDSSVHRRTMDEIHDVGRVLSCWPCHRRVKLQVSPDAKRTRQSANKA
jgi:hypothetical protein